MLFGDLDAFLTQSRISLEDWHSSNLSWEDLLMIGYDHEEQRTLLEASATSNASLIQRFSGVHSVRWRVKDSRHLMAKIVRKRAAQESKYVNISASNYMEVVDDLIGLRALHLFKDDCFEIDRDVRAVFPLREQPIAYIREGDNRVLTKKYEETGMLVKKHVDNYRSIHYILTTQPTRRIVNAELQVRTIFEEGWSEIDHKVRYPNFPNSQHLKGILDILNGMAGQADDIGGLIQKLSKELRSAIRVNEGARQFSDERIESIVPTREGAGCEQPALLVEDGVLNVGKDAPLDQFPNEYISADPQTIGGLTSVPIQQHKNILPATRIGDQRASFTIAQQALDTHNSAMKALQNIDQVGAAVKAMEERNVAMHSFRVLDEHNAAMKALQNIDQLGAVVKAMDEQNAVKKALGGHDAVRKVLDDQNAIKKALGGHDAVRKVLDDQDAIKKALGGTMPFRKC